MSLRTLFVLMALVSGSLVAAVIWTKVLVPPGQRPATVAERRAVVRICEEACGRLAPEVIRDAPSAEAVRETARACVEDCVARRLPQRPAP